MTQPQHELKYLSIDDVVPNPWNPQHMDEAMFARLVEEIKENGCTAAIQVVPLADGSFRIIGGEHRWRACQEAGLEQVPCTVLQGKRWQDEDLQKFETVRLNVIGGKMNTDKFIKLYEEMADKYGKDALQQLMGYVDTRQFQKLVGEVKRGMKQALPKEMHAEFDEKAKESKTVEDLGTVIQTLFAKFGDTVQQSFMVFTFGKKEHVYVQMTRPMKKALDKALNYCRESGADINDLLAPILEEAASDAQASLDAKGKKKSKKSNVA